MNIEISGKGFTVGESFRGRIQSELQKKVTKYFKNAISANVTVTGKHDGVKTITISINEGTGRDMEIRARAENRDLDTSFNEAIDKIEKQLRRYHKRLNNHKRSVGEQVKLENTDLIQIKKYVLTADQDEEHDENDGEISPVIIAEKYSNLEYLSVKDAVMKMNLSSLPALMFINKANDRLNVVYHREDGHVSWIDPSEYYDQKVKKIS